MVIVTTYVAHVLEWIICPTLNSHLWVLNSTCNTKVDILFISRNAIHKTGILATKWSANSITDIVAECTNLVKHMSIDLQSNLLFRICWSHSCPALAVDNNIRINCMKTLADLIHCVDIMNSHQVKTEAIDMVFFHPPLKRLNHVFTEHGLL